MGLFLFCLNMIVFIICICGFFYVSKPYLYGVYILTFIREFWKNPERGTDGPSLSGVSEKIQNAAFHQFVYVPMLWFFSEIALSDGPKNGHIFFLTGIFTVKLAYASLNLNHK